MNESQKALAADVRRLLEEAGIDPDKIATVPLFPGMLRMLIAGKWSKRQFIDNCQKVAIMNGGKIDSGLRA